MSFNKLSAGLFALLVFNSMNAFAHTKVLGNYDELLQALDSGEKVRGVIQLEKCKLESGGGLPKTISVGFDFDYYNHFNVPVDPTHTVEVISTTKNIFTITKVNDLGPINNYIQIHISKDNIAHIFGAILDPKNYDQKIFVNYTCPMSADSAKAGLMLYNQDA